MLVISYTRPDGGVSVVYPVISKDDPQGFTAEDALVRASNSVPADATEITVLDSASLPSRRFRDAWRTAGGNVRVAIVGARLIRLRELRQERDQRLRESDVEYMKRQEQNAPDLSEWRTYRQSLRDLPQTEQPTLDGLTTEEQLTAYQPSWPAKP